MNGARGATAEVLAPSRGARRRLSALQLNDHCAQLTLHLSEQARFFFDACELLLADSHDGRQFFRPGHALGGGAICNRGVQLKQFSELGQRESHGLAPLDESQAFEVRGCVDSIAGRGSLRRAQESPPFVEPNGLDADADGFCELANAHGRVRSSSSNCSGDLHVLRFQ